MLELYITCLVLGFILLGAEIYVPGGILGTIGSVALLTAIIVGFRVEAFGTQGGIISAFIIVLTVVAGLFFWLNYFPRTPVGRKLALEYTGVDFKADDANHRDLKGKTGRAINNLRPSGLAIIDGERMDVVADGSYIEKDSRVMVVDVGGNRVVVRKLADDDAGTESV